MAKKNGTIKNGSETLEHLNEFADLCRETTGASFTFSKNKPGNWVVTLVNKGQQFLNADLIVAVIDAKKWLLEHRVEVEVETKYTLYGK
jgi:hypothetical protein